MFLKNKMQFRRISKEDYEQHQQLMIYSFQPHRNSYEKIDYAIYDLFPNQHKIFGLFHQDQLISTLSVFFTFQNIRNSFMKVACFFAGATKPEYRSKGLMKDLFSRTFEICESENCAISNLYPLSFIYFQRLDFVCFDNQTIITSISTNIKKISSQFNLSDLFIVEETDHVKALKRIDPIYNLEYKKINGLLDRKNLLTKRFSKGFFFFCVDVKGNDLGYMVLDYNDKETIMISELVGTNRESRAKFWEFLRQHDFDNKNFKIIDFIEHSIQTLPYLNDLSKLKIETKMNSMYRIISFSKTMSQLEFPVNSINFKINIIDPLIEANNGIWNLEFRDKKCFSKKIDEKNGQITEIDIKGVELLINGSKNTTELYELGFISYDFKIMKILDNLFPKCRCILRDWF